jgi:hypothetical protein
MIDFFGWWMYNNNNIERHRMTRKEKYPKAIPSRKN